MLKTVYINSNLRNETSLDEVRRMHIKSNAYKQIRQNMTSSNEFRRNQNSGKFDELRRFQTKSDEFEEIRRTQTNSTKYDESNELRRIRGNLN